MWRNGRRARFRSVCPKGRGGSTPPIPTRRPRRLFVRGTREPAGPSRHICSGGRAPGSPALRWSRSARHSRTLTVRTQRSYLARVNRCCGGRVASPAGSAGAHPRQAPLPPHSPRPSPNLGLLCTCAGQSSPRPVLGPAGIPCRQLRPWLDRASRPQLDLSALSPSVAPPARAHLRAPRKLLSPVCAGLVWVNGGRWGVGGYARG
jgi:hypothetical protein